MNRKIRKNKSPERPARFKQLNNLGRLLKEPRERVQGLCGILDGFFVELRKHI